MTEVTWWGHSTVTIDDDVRIITDPLFAYRVGHLRRRRGQVPGPAAREADAVLISHLHVDHLHLPSLRQVSATAPVVAPRGTRALLASAGERDLADRCTEVVAGDEVEVAGTSVRAVPAKHSGRRHPWSRHRGPALGYILTTRHHITWFAGDTDLFDGMGRLGRIDLALVPVGGWGPTLGPGHLDPERAAEAVRRAAPGIAVPIHYGTYWPTGLDPVRPYLFLGPEREFATRAKTTAPDTDVRVLEVGASTTL
ncbi:MBL fold metallo-hydrolase [Spirillospora sp. NPDC047279]|uniref:MBL fold metallo-hydrolase n=1 Tax=Spirillospora sp. NPDC047279 TaxID=3155478 RepID=UPI0033F71C34